MPDEEGLALYHAAAEAAASGLGPLLEIGTYCAKSTVYLAAGAREGSTKGGPVPLVFSVDHHRGSEEIQPGWPHHDPELMDGAAGVMDSLPWARRTLAAAGVEQGVVLVVGESSAVAGWWGTALAMVFIDGGHGEQVAWADYHGWVPKLAPGGLLAVHDVFAHPPEGGQAPYQIFRHALASGQFTEQVARGSLRVLHRSSPSA